MKIDGIKPWVNKDGIQQYDVISIYETPKASGIWAITGRWRSSSPPVIDQPVTYLRGQYGYWAVPDERS